jgi:hypothetical protein
MTLHALRGKIGDDAFFRTLKAFTKTFGGGGRVDRRLHLDRRARVGPAAGRLLRRLAVRAGQAGKLVGA